MNWIKKAFKDVGKRGTEGVCTGSKFGGPSCLPGTKRHQMAANLRKLGRKRAQEDKAAGIVAQLLG